MSTLMLAFAALLYAVAAIDEALTGRWPMAVVFAAYALANVGLMGVVR